MDDVLIVAIIFGFSLVAIKLILDFMKERSHSKSTSSAGSSLTTSELKMLVQDAVEEAVDERFTQFEKRLEKRSDPKLIPAAGKNDPEVETRASPPVGSDRETAR